MVNGCETDGRLLGGFSIETWHTGEAKVGRQLEAWVNETLSSSLVGEIEWYGSLSRASCGMSHAFWNHSTSAMTCVEAILDFHGVGVAIGRLRCQEYVGTREGHNE
jgi:hypothetical protein